MKILLIGGGGFVGFHLREALLRKNHEVFCADLPSVVSKSQGMLPVDLMDGSSVESLLKEIRPERVFLLAAISSVALSWKNPELAVNVNILGALTVFRVMEKVVPNARLIYIGSGEEYGSFHTENHPTTEEDGCNPCNPYAVTKFTSGKLLELISIKRNLGYVHLRPLNHFGPFQREGFVIADFCAQIARMEAGRCKPVMKIGNLSAERDFLYVDDIVDAYCMIAEAEKCPHPVYNIATGKVHSIQQILDYLLAQAKIEIKVETDPEKFRPVEVPAIIASNELISRDFGWTPKTTLESGLQNTLNWWRKKIEEESGVAVSMNS